MISNLHNIEIENENVHGDLTRQCAFILNILHDFCCCHFANQANNFYIFKYVF